MGDNIGYIYHVCENVVRESNYNTFIAQKNNKDYGYFTTAIGALEWLEAVERNDP